MSPKGPHPQRANVKPSARLRGKPGPGLRGQCSPLARGNSCSRALIHTSLHRFHQGLQSKLANNMENPTGRIKAQL